MGPRPSKGAELIAAVATPPGKGGIGVVRLSGDGTRALENKVLDKPARTGAICRRDFIDADGSVIDSGLALSFAAPRSYTGEDVLELHGHGGEGVMQRLLRRCTDLGARPANPGEFTLRAFLNGKISLSEAEAVADLVNVSTAKAARMAAASMKGALARRTEDMSAAILGARRELEAMIDFADEDISPKGHDALRSDLTALAGDLERLLDQCQRSVAYGQGATIALVGAPNAGKSSILNHACAKDAAIVDAAPGTTRDIVQARCDLGGVPVTLLDTAGIRDGGGDVEREGMRRARQAMREADLVVLVHDASSGENMIDIGTKPAMVAHNKIDLCGLRPGVRDGDAHVSAKTGAGMESFLAKLGELAGAGPDEPPFLARQRHVDAIGNARAHVLEASKATIDMPEQAAEHLRLAQDRLGEISGRISTEDLLGEIFSRFCIGK